MGTPKHGILGLLIFFSLCSPQKRISFPTGTESSGVFRHSTREETMQKEGTQERSEATSSWDYTQGWVTFGQHCPCAQPDTEKIVWLTSNGSNAHLKQI